MDNRITAHMVVKNEDRFIWYAISAVLPYVDRIFIFDTGSTDKTVKIVESFKDKKIVFEQKNESMPGGITKLRGEQINKTETSWIWLLDGDEVYPRETIKKILQIINADNSLEGIIVHRYDLLGDIYHYQDENVGAYDQFGKTGHYVLRLINRGKIKNLGVSGNYPNEFFTDEDDKSIKLHGKEKFAFVEERFFHAMYLQRSTEKKSLSQIINRKKIKFEWGKLIPFSNLPKVFFQKRPVIIPDVTLKYDWKFAFMAGMITPIKKIKRKIFSFNS